MLRQTGRVGPERMSTVERMLLGDAKSSLERLVPQRFPGFLRAALTRWLIALGCGGLVALLIIGPGVNRFQFWPLLGLLMALWVIAGFTLSSADEKLPTLVSYIFILFSPSIGLSVWLAGPRFEAVGVLIPMWVCVGAVLLRRRGALIATALSILSYAAVVFAGDGYMRPVARTIFLAGVTTAGAVIFLRFANELVLLAERLESRVEEQGGEIDRLGRLRRFLSPQVADTVLSEGAEALLATHRRQIAVIFVDLRGFTGFSAVAEPEDVVDLLADFFAAIGTNLKRLDATVGGFAGDSVMAYFNDPVPCDDPAGRALDAARSLDAPMRELSERWRKRGFSIGYGVGIAYGYATLGIIGFEERNDYTPIGSVVNLASRLCDEAGPGELLLDSRAYEAVREAVQAEDVTLSLKGFSAAVTAYRVQL